MYVERSHGAWADARLVQIEILDDEHHGLVVAGDLWRGQGGGIGGLISEKFETPALSSHCGRRLNILPVGISDPPRIHVINSSSQTYLNVYGTENPLKSHISHNRYFTKSLVVSILFRFNRTGEV
jgi:hypothetical protein